MYATFFIFPFPLPNRLTPSKKRDLLVLLAIFCFSCLVFFPAICYNRCNHSSYFGLGVGEEKLREVTANWKCNYDRDPLLLTFF